MSKDKKKDKKDAPDGHPTKRKENFKSEPQTEEQRQSSRPGVWFSNYDYTQEGPNETSPGGGLYHGPMDKYKSVKDFLEKRKKENEKVKSSIASRHAVFVEALDD